MSSTDVIVSVRGPSAAVAATNTVTIASVADTICVEVTLTPEPITMVVRPATNTVFELPTRRTAVPVEPRRADTGCGMAMASTSSDRPPAISPVVVLRTCTAAVPTGRPAGPRDGQASHVLGGIEHHDREARHRDRGPGGRSQHHLVVRRATGANPDPVICTVTPATPPAGRPPTAQSQRGAARERR